MVRELPVVPIRSPSRIARHRFACLALYRALLRSALDIKVSVKAPEDIQNPIWWLIRGQFRRNRKEANPRFVYSSLSAGYKFLDLFAKAKVSGSPEHASVTEHVESRLRSLEAWRARNPPKEQPKKEPPAPRLLRRLPPKTDDPNEPPVYVSDLLPRPKSALKGPRKIPRLCITNFEVPFLRFKKPQPERLSMRLLSEYYRSSEKIEGLAHIKDNLMEEALHEDRWESEVRRRALTEWKERGKWPNREEEEFLDEADTGDTYVRCLRQVVRMVEDEMSRERTDRIAQADALLEIVKKEKALAEEEAREAGNDVS